MKVFDAMNVVTLFYLIQHLGGTFGDRSKSWLGIVGYRLVWRILGWSRPTSRHMRKQCLGSLWLQF